ncbi:PAS domain-containing protein [Streptomyces sp. NPDC004546]|uniref:PAS domain-containing protein n=1 Tax=Streptomyces sp. NPDC004546 TaxID=3154282 RepID=UPI0033B319B6
MAHDEAISPVEGAAVLEALFHQSPTGLLILDTELRILRINLTRPVLHAVPPEQITGRHVTEVYDLSALPLPNTSSMQVGTSFGTNRGRSSRSYRAAAVGAA